MKTIAPFNDKKNFSDGKPKMTKKFGFEISKSPEKNKKTFFGPKTFFWSIFTQFQNFQFFSVFNAYSVDFLHVSPIFRKMLN